MRVKYQQWGMTLLRRLFIFVFIVYYCFTYSAFVGVD